MASKTLDIIASTMMILPLLIFIVLDITHSNNIGYSPDDFEYESSFQNYANSGFYILLTVVCSLLYFAICVMHIARIRAQGWKMFILAATSLSAIAIILLICLVKRWDLPFRLLLGIDIVAIMVLLMYSTFRVQATNTIIVAVMGSILVVAFIFFCDIDHDIDAPTITSNVILDGAYLVIFWLYVKHMPDLIWRALTMLLFTGGFIAILVGIFYLHRQITIVYVLVGVDGMFAFTLWLLMNALNVKKLRDFYSEHEEPLRNESMVVGMAGIPMSFTINYLNKATRNFETPIGEGASGSVFKGVREDGSTIAVKRIKGQQSGEVEFMNEIKIIASLKHVNLVHLLGFSLTLRGDRYLIYPFFENGSLDSWLFAQEEKRCRLTWSIRYKISIYVAKALHYLHYDCSHRILHLDIKPANILLDESFRALVTDFGISKSIGREQSSVMTRARGTIGYLPPEMLVPNAISVKSDVYSYGMVLLELVGGRRNFQSIVDEETQQRRNTYFPKIAKEKMKDGKLMEVVDESLIKHDQDINEEEVTVLVKVALWCIQENLELRPTTTEVVDMLEGRKPILMPPESPMFVVNFLDVESSSASTGRSYDLPIPASSNNTISIEIQSR